MSPLRDPNTGEFVSSADFDSLRADMDCVTGSIRYTIPAADNPGGTTNGRVDGDTAEIIDFTPILDDDELFHISMMSLTLSLGLPTTATTESFGSVEWRLRTDFGDAGEAEAGEFYNASVAREQGIVDVDFAQEEESSIIDAGALYAESSFNDTVAASGGGGQVANEHRYLKMGADLGATLTVDEDDELAIPAILRTEGVDDHRISFGAVLVCYGDEVRG